MKGIEYLSPKALYLHKLTNATEEERNEFLASFIHQTNTVLDFLINELSTPEMLDKMVQVIKAKISD
jgi:hypothetical protein